MISRTTIAARLLFIGGVLLLALVALIVRGQAPGITFATGGLQLEIDSHTVYNGVVQPSLSWALKDLVPGVDRFFHFSDIKPGDSGQTTISLHTDKDAWGCLLFSNLTDKDNGNNEPEAIEDANGAGGGELSKGVEFFGWKDDGDYAFEVGEVPLFGTSTQSGFEVLKKQYALADALSGQAYDANETYYVGIQWCAGNLEVNLRTAAITCDGSVLGNTAQTDSFSADLSLGVVPKATNPNFTCSTPAVPGLKLFLEKKFSGPSQGFHPSQFKFRVMGNGIDEEVPHGGSLALPVGSYTITELVPPGFVVPEWRIQWSGDLCGGSNTAGGIGTITVKERDLKKGKTFCRADNQYRPIKKRP